MSNTFTRKKTQGQLQKEENKKQNKINEKIQEEMEEAAKWVEGSYVTTKNDLKNMKSMEKKKHKEDLKMLFMKEMEE